VPEPKILLFDIETSLTRVYVFDLYPKHGGTNVVEIDEPWYMLSFSWKWLGQKHTCVAALPDFPGYAKNRSCDKALVTELYRLISEADIIVAHNGDRFDLRKSNARFIEHGFAPPAPYKTVDTLKIARKHFKFDSNRLDDLGHFLGVGRKLANTGKALWLGCMSGDPKSWDKMRRYNKQDVRLLEAVYLKLRAWTTTHPNLDHYTRANACPVCQSKDLVRHSFAYISTGKRQRMTCKGCGHRFATGKLIKDAA
jgi:RNase_H superfamily